MKEYYNDVFDIWVSYDEQQVKKNDIYLLKGIQLLLVVLLPLIIVKVVKAETCFKRTNSENQEISIKSFYTKDFRSFRDRNKNKSKHEKY